MTKKVGKGKIILGDIMKAKDKKRKFVFFTLKNIIIFSIARIDNQNTKIYSNSQDYYNLAVTHFNRMEYDKAFYFAEQAAQALLPVCNGRCIVSASGSWNRYNIPAQRSMYWTDSDIG